MGWNNNMEIATVEHHSDSGPNEAVNENALAFREDTLYTKHYISMILPGGLLAAVISKCVSCEGYYHGAAINSVLKDLLAPTLFRSSASAIEGTAPTLSQYSDFAQAAAYLNMDQRTLRRKVDLGLVEYIDYNRAVGGNRDMRFTKAALDKFVIDSTVPAKSSPSRRPCRQTLRSLRKQHA